MSPIDLVHRVTAETGCDPSSPESTASVVRARELAVLLLRDRFGLKFLQIGRLLDRHHSTCVMAYQRGSLRYENDETFKALWDKLAEECPLPEFFA